MYWYYYDEKEQLIKYDFKTETKEVIDYKTEHQCFDMVYDTYITVTKEELLQVNARLNKIKKPTK